jgi:hypothetical protein
VKRLLFPYFVLLRNGNNRFVKNPTYTLINAPISQRLLGECSSPVFLSLGQPWNLPASTFQAVPFTGSVYRMFLGYVCFLLSLIFVPDNEDEITIHTLLLSGQPSSCLNRNTMYLPCLCMVNRLFWSGFVDRSAVTRLIGWQIEPLPAIG